MGLHSENGKLRIRYVILCLVLGQLLYAPLCTLSALPRQRSQRSREKEPKKESGKSVSLVNPVISIRIENNTFVIEYNKQFVPVQDNGATTYKFIYKDDAIKLRYVTFEGATEDGTNNPPAPRCYPIGRFTMDIHVATPELKITKEDIKGTHPPILIRGGSIMFRSKPPFDSTYENNKFNYRPSVDLVFLQLLVNVPNQDPKIITIENGGSIKFFSRCP